MAFADHDAVAGAQARADRIRGLRTAAAWLENHPAVPVPAVIPVLVYATSDLLGADRVARIAAALDTPAHTAPDGTTSTSGRFDGVRIRFYYVPTNRQQGNR
jgi:hypothetical protein